MNDTGLSREAVVEECMGLVAEGLLEVIYEVDCPYCFSPLTHGDKAEAKTVDCCIYCGQEDIEVEKEEYFHRFILKAAANEPIKHPVESRNIHDATTWPAQEKEHDSLLPR